MFGLIVLGLLILIGLGFFLYKNQQDENSLQDLLKETEAEDEEHDKTSVI